MTSLRPRTGQHGYTMDSVVLWDARTIRASMHRQIHIPIGTSPGIPLTLSARNVTWFALNIPLEYRH